MVNPAQEGSIPISYARALLRAVADQGVDEADFLSAEGLTKRHLSTDDSISMTAFGRLYQRAILLLKDESLGMVNGGQPVTSGTFRMMCLCVIHCSTLEQIIHRAGEFLDVCRGVVIKPRLSDAGESVAVGFALAEHIADQSLSEVLQREDPLRVRTSLFMWHNLLCWFAGKPLMAEQVEFAFDSPAKGDQWSRLFRCPVSFSCQASQIRYPAESLAVANVQTEDSLRVFLKSTPYRLIVPSYDDRSVSDRVLAVFGDDFSRPLPGADVVAERLALSVSTLRRQLAEEGTSFQRLKDDCRRAAAMQYLASTELSFREVAGLLGFDDVSAFYRAFKRWTQVTPSQYRDNLQA